MLPQAVHTTHHTHTPTLDASGMQLSQNLVLLGILCGMMPMDVAGKSVPVAKQQLSGGSQAEPATDTGVVQLRHIKRQANSVPVMPMDLQTKHAPCDMDSRGATSYVFAFPNHCIWSYNNRYLSEGHYRVYKIYQLEAFFFGQYHERMKRYETDPHTYDYSLT
ncbi:uncharacterized protein [Drosophila bipectinata]|uniref:uncharacterized protein isoform X2 n=1 Tax=Drosophila bipectinata TaxID=42026 RepID=UPI001C8A38FE|nr:uncharacterized protein LOC108121406 isoform X2 [Drosophila bipectinata]